MRKTTFLGLAVAVFLAACGSEPTEKYFSKEGVALQGYDVVSYFTSESPLQGNEAVAAEYDGFTYQFVSDENKQLFEADPDKYLPSYGGWCAYAVAESATKMEPDPLNWQIQDGKLQLFVESWQTKLMGSLKDEWNSDPEDFTLRADSNWEQMN